MKLEKKLPCRPVIPYLPSAGFLALASEAVTKGHSRGNTRQWLRPLIWSNMKLWIPQSLPKSPLMEASTIHVTMSISHLLQR